MCGVPAANLAYVPEFLADRIEENRLRHLKENTDANGLARAINRLRPERETYICLADENDPWTLHWIERTAQALRTAERGGGLRVVFRAGPTELWNCFVSDLPVEYLVATNSLFDWVPLQPWSAPFLQRWCSDPRSARSRCQKSTTCSTSPAAGHCSSSGMPLLARRLGGPARPKSRASLPDSRDEISRCTWPRRVRPAPTCPAPRLGNTRPERRRSLRGTLVRQDSRTRRRQRTPSAPVLGQHNLD